MNLHLHSTQEQAQEQTFHLMQLFELKGYSCKIEQHEKHTLYSFCANRESRIDYTNPNWQIIRG
jgi:hypothetical protein